ANASLVVVPSFDEGLSLPVIEALAAGTPVVASDIPAHRELLGTGTFLADPRSPASFANAITKHRGSFTTCKQQYVHLRKHRHLELSETIRERVTAASPGKQTTREQAKENEHASRASGHLRIALVTPWAPQATGVGDFSTVIGIELARHVDLTVIITSDADVPASLVDVNDPPSVTTLPLNSVLDDPQQLARFDRVIAVIGNSHFHLPILELTRLWPCAVIAHDTRMNEFYLAADGRGPTEQLMLRSADSTAPANIAPVLEEQIADMRLLQNAAMWEVAHRAHPLILHSQSAAPLIERQTGIRPRLLPFANYRAPEFVPDAQERAHARARLGLSPEAVHLATFGYVDLRTKLTDVVLEAAGWLTRWGHAVHLHVVGQASQADTESLKARAQDWGLDGFTVTGFTSDADFRDYLLAVDLGIQLRVSPFLGVSGPLSDLAAYGTRGMGSEGLCIDVDAPAFISRLPQAVSPTMLATAIEEVLQTPRDELLIEQQRRDYLASKTAQAYVQQLLDLLREEAP
ncbi:MAG TPA: glycosyltransferase, partial [Acidimicrobiia bacterium]